MSSTNSQTPAVLADPGPLLDLAMVRDTSEGITTPFQLELPGEVLHCQDILRRLANNRIVARAQWAGRPVLAKLFFGRKAERDAARERTGVTLLQAAGVPTPALLADIALPPQGRVLLFDYLDQAVTLLPSNPGVDLKAMQATCTLLARLHHHGVRHSDLHLNNFLLAQDRVYAIDAGALRAARPFALLSRRESPQPLSPGASRRDLADLLAQLPLSWDERMAALWSAYAEARNWSAGKGREAGWRRLVMRARRKRIRRYQRKSLRNCTEFQASRTFSSLLTLRRAYAGPDLEQLLRQPDVALRQGRLLKAGNTATLAEVEADGRRYVIKRYNIKSMRHWLSRCWRPSRALRSWHNALQLEMLGIPTATPVALLERRFGPLRGRAYLLTEALPGPDLLHAVQGPRYASAEKSVFLQQAIGLLTRLAAAGLVHGDTKATNFLLAADGVKLIDLDSLNWPRARWRQRRGIARDQARFLHNWLDQASVLAEVRQAFNTDDA